MAYFNALISGICTASSFAPNNYIFLSLISVGFAFKILTKVDSSYIGFKLGYFYGLGYCFVAFNWVSNVAYHTEYPKLLYFLIISGLPLVLALYFALQFSFFVFVKSKLKADEKFQSLIFCLVWVLFEFIRSNFPFEGFPWALIAQSLWFYSSFIQSLGIFGELGLGFSLVFLSCSTILLFKKIYSLFFIASILFTSIYIYGKNRLSYVPEFYEEYINVIQVSGQEYNNFSNYIKMSDENTINIWPESVGYFEEFSKISRKNLIILSGATYYFDNQMFNSLIFSGNSTYDMYHKSHLVPFGEYLPFRKYMPKFLSNFITSFIGYDLSRGNENKIIEFSFKDKQFRILPVICYEIIFSKELINRAKDTEFDSIVNVTNDYWYGDSSGPKQHLVIAKYRAIEMGAPVIRSATNGISSIILPNGDILEALNFNQTGNIKSKFPKRYHKTLYFNYKNADWIFIVFMSLLSVLVIKPYKPKKI